MFTVVGGLHMMTEPTEDELLVKAKQLVHEDGRLSRGGWTRRIVDESLRIE
jgi:hypothetical protein